MSSNPYDMYYSWHAYDMYLKVSGCTQRVSVWPCNLTVWVSISIWPSILSRGWSTANICYLCKKNKGLVHHSVVHCGVFWEPWAAVFIYLFIVFWFHSSWVLPGTMEEVLLSRQGSPIKKATYGWGWLSFVWHGVSRRKAIWGLSRF